VCIVNSNPQITNPSINESDRAAFNHVIQWLNDKGLHFIANILSKIVGKDLSTRQVDVLTDPIHPQQIQKQQPTQVPQPPFPPGASFTGQPPRFWFTSQNPPAAGTPYTPNSNVGENFKDTPSNMGATFFIPTTPQGKTQQPTQVPQPPSPPGASFTGQPPRFWFTSQNPPAATPSYPTAAATHNRTVVNTTADESDVDPKITGARESISHGLKSLKQAGDLKLSERKFATVRKKEGETKTYAHALLKPIMSLICDNFKALSGGIKLTNGELPANVTEAIEFANKFSQKDNASIIQAAHAADDAIKSTDDTVALGQAARLERQQTWQRVFFEKLGIEVPKELLSPLPPKPATAPMESRTPDEAKPTYVKNPPGQPSGIYQMDADGNLQKIQPSSLTPDEKIEISKKGPVVIPRGFEVCDGGVVQKEDFQKKICYSTVKRALDALQKMKIKDKYVNEDGEPLFRAPPCLRELSEGVPSELYVKYDDGLYYLRSIIDATKDKPVADTSTPAAPAARQVQLKLTPVAAAIPKPATSATGSTPTTHHKRRHHKGKNARPSPSKGTPPTLGNPGTDRSTIVNRRPVEPGKATLPPFQPAASQIQRTATKVEIDKCRSATMCDNFRRAFRENFQALKDNLDGSIDEKDIKDFFGGTGIFGVHRDIVNQSLKLNTEAFDFKFISPADKQKLQNDVIAMLSELNEHSKP
jgi:hypothetical protein